MTKFRNVSAKALMALALCFGVGQAYAVDWFIGVDYGGYPGDEDYDANHNSGDSNSFSIGFRKDDRWTYEIAFRNYSHTATFTNTIHQVDYAALFNNAAITLPDGSAYTAPTASTGSLGTVGYISDGNASVNGSTVAAGDAVAQVDATPDVVVTPIAERLNTALATDAAKAALYTGVTVDNVVPGFANDTFVAGAMPTTFTVQDVKMDDSSIAFSVSHHWSFSDNFDMYWKVGFDTLDMTKTVHFATVGGGNGTVSVDLAEIPAEAPVLQQVVVTDTVSNEERSAGALVSGQDPAPTNGTEAEQALRATIDFSDLTRYPSQVLEYDSGFITAIGGEWKATNNLSVTLEYEISTAERWAFGLKYFFK